MTERKFIPIEEIAGEWEVDPEFVAAYEACADEFLEYREATVTKKALMEITEFPDGLTVAELKRIIADWPETNEDGDPTEVWVDNLQGFSNQVKSVSPLNKRTHEDQTVSADLLLQI